MAQQVMFNSASIKESRLKLARSRRKDLPVNYRRGFTMIEMIVFIVIVAIALAGIFLVLNVTVAKSADPMIRKNMLSIAESLLEEVELMPMTYCDPSTSADPNQVWVTATSTTSCAIAQGLGPSHGELRVSTTNPYNNVADYSGGSQGSVISGTFAGLGTFGTGATPIMDISGSNPAPTGYYATIGLTAELLDGIASTPAAATMNVVRITVTVYYGSNSIVVEGYRARYFPNNLPW